MPWTIFGGIAVLSYPVCEAFAADQMAAVFREVDYCSGDGLQEPGYGVLLWIVQIDGFHVFRLGFRKRSAVKEG
jgi:hypothetical protein